MQTYLTDFNSILTDSKQGVKFDQNRYTNQTCNSLKSVTDFYIQRVD